MHSRGQSLCRVANTTRISCILYLIAHEMCVSVHVYIEICEFTDSKSVRRHEE